MSKISNVLVLYIHFRLCSLCISFLFSTIYSIPFRVLTVLKYFKRKSKFLFFSVLLFLHCRHLRQYDFLLVREDVIFVKSRKKTNLSNLTRLQIYQSVTFRVTIATTGEVTFLFK